MSDVRSPTKAKHRWRSEFRAWLSVALGVFALHSLVAKPFYIPSESMMPNLLVGDNLVVSKYPYGWSYASASFHLLPFVPGRLLGRLPERGDIVIIDRVENGGREDLIKRVIGLPGDTVQMRNGRLWLNGRPVSVQDLGQRLFPVDRNFHCDADDPDPERRFRGFAGARLIDASGRMFCRLHVVRETLPEGRSYDTLDFGSSVEDDTRPYIVQPGHVFVLGDNRDNSADSRVALEFGGLGGAVPLEAIGGRAEFVTFSTTGNAVWNPLTWRTAFRSGRFALSLR